MTRFDVLKKMASGIDIIPERKVSLDPRCNLRKEQHIKPTVVEVKYIRDTWYEMVHSGKANILATLNSGIVL